MRFNFSAPFQYVILQAGSEKKLLSARGCYPDIKPNSVIHTRSDCIMQKIVIVFMF